MHGQADICVYSLPRPLCFKYKHTPDPHPAPSLNNMLCNRIYGSFKMKDSSISGCLGEDSIIPQCGD